MLLPPAAAGCQAPSAALALALAVLVRQLLH